jgi:hypothetical protein
MDKMVVAQQVLAFVRGFETVGFSGSRSLSGPGLACAEWLGRHCNPDRVIVGCANGADAVFRQAFSHSQVIRVQGTGRNAFAARSIAVVSAVNAANGCWVSFPEKPCPEVISPSAKSKECFCGSGSGSWASLAFAVGLGASCLIYLPEGIRPPYWGFQPIGLGWWEYRYIQPGPGEPEW